MICDICKEDKEESNYRHVLEGHPTICCKCKYMEKLGVKPKEKQPAKLCAYCKKKTVESLRRKYCCGPCADAANEEYIKKNWRRKIITPPAIWGGYKL